MNAINPEAIGVFGLIVTVWCFGAEQLGLGVKDGNPKEIQKSLAYIAILFGGATQVFTAIAMYFYNVLDNAAMSTYLGAVFADYGIFWIIIGVFFLKGGDKKMIAHFFFIQFLISSVFLYQAFLLAKMWPLGIVLLLICGLFIILVPAWYGKGVIYTKIAGALNILIGLFAIPLFIHALGL